MTEKRFTVIYNEQSIMMQYVDNCKEEPNAWAVWNTRETAQKLNQLNDENEQLQKDCTALIYSNQDYRKENKQLKEDVKYFNETYSVQEYGLDIETHIQLSSPIPSRKELLKENEQLKESVNNLKETIIKITIAYQRKYDRNIVDLVHEIHEEDISDLIKELEND